MSALDGGVAVALARCVFEEFSWLEVVLEVVLDAARFHNRHLQQIPVDAALTFLFCRAS